MAWRAIFLTCGAFSKIHISFSSVSTSRSCNRNNLPMEEDDSVIRVDESLSDEDSSYGDDSDRESQTTSLYSAITKYVYENGRRYHSYRYGTYW
jgi:hypothetical protein